MPAEHCTHDAATDKHSKRSRQCPAGALTSGSAQCAHLRNALTDGANNAGVDLEQVVTRHAGLAGHACRDDDEVAVCKRLRQLLFAMRADLGFAVAVREVDANTCGKNACQTPPGPNGGARIAMQGDLRDQVAVTVCTRLASGAARLPERVQDQALYLALRAQRRTGKVGPRWGKA